MKKTIRLGTRESQLALAQTKLAAQALKEAFPEVETEICGRRTLGDRILDRPLLSFGGKGVFVTEFEEKPPDFPHRVCAHENGNPYLLPYK